MKKNYVGINIQWPISELILSGQKTVETRTYALPKKYLNCDLLIIETPGKQPDFKARIAGIIRFSGSFKYDSRKDFDADFERHLVKKDSPWYWRDKPKWGWDIAKVVKFKKAIRAPLNKGIVFTTGIDL